MQEFVQQLKDAMPEGHKVWHVNADMPSTKRVVSALSTDSKGTVWHHFFLPKTGNEQHRAAIQNFLPEQIQKNWGLQGERLQGSHPEYDIVGVSLPRDKIVFNSAAQEAIKNDTFSRFDLPDEMREWLGERHLSSRQSQSLVFSAGSDALRAQQSYAPLQSTLREIESTMQYGGDNNLNAQKYKKLVEYLDSNPQVAAELERHLDGLGLDKGFKFCGTGATGVFLESPDGVIMGIRGSVFDNPNAAKPLNAHPIIKRPIPQHIQPLHEATIGGLQIEMTPKLDIQSVTQSDIQHLDASIAKTPHPKEGWQWVLGDKELRNSGKSKTGTCYVLDGDCIAEAEAAGLKADSKAASNWLCPDGKWKQYEEFQPLHERFNSPLHQGSGKLNAVALEVGQAAHAPVINNTAAQSSFVQKAIKNSAGEMHWGKVSGIAIGAVAVGSGIYWLASKRNEHQKPWIARVNNESQNQSIARH
jgi:hypothetical protein